MSSVYRPLLRRAWSIAWHEKRLWIFGFFTAVVVSGGELNMFIRNYERVQSLGGLIDVARKDLFALPLSFIEKFTDYLIGFYVIVTLLLALVVFLLWFAVVAEGALVWGIERVRRRSDYRIDEGIAQGRKMWNSMALLIIGFFMSARLAWVLFALPPFLIYLSIGSSGWFTLFLIIAFLCLIPVGCIVTLLFRMAVVAVAVDHESPRNALSIAWRLFCRHWLVLIETTALLVVGTSLAALAALAVAAIGITLLFGPLLLIGFVVGAPAVLSIVIGLASLCFLCVLLTIGALLAVFQQAVWVLLFARLQDSPPLAKLIRFFAERKRMFSRASRT